MTESGYLGLRDSVLVVTGASSGIGRATAIKAGREGARVALLGRRPEALAETAGMLEGEGHLALPLDVTDHAAIPDALKQVREEFGPVDGVFHAAGAHAVTPLRAVTAKRAAELFDLNVTSGLMLAKAFRNPGIRAGRSSMVLMSSAVGLVGGAGVSVYAATKAAIASLGKSLALELARDDVRVNSIAAGMVRTPLTDGIRDTVGEAGWEAIEEAHPLGMGTVDDVANAALFLLSPASRWVTGTVLVVDGGYTAK